MRALRIALGNYGTDVEIAPQGEDNHKGMRLGGVRAQGIQCPKIAVPPLAAKVCGWWRYRFLCFYGAARVMLWVPCHPSGEEVKPGAASAITRCVVCCCARSHSDQHQEQTLWAQCSAGSLAIQPPLKGLRMTGGGRKKRKDFCLLLLRLLLVQVAHKSGM